jgi:HAD superfamily hydrolase (TIGR01509 family)
LLTALDAVGMPTALVSASSRRIVDAGLASIGPDHFRFTVSGDDVTLGKPDPEPYLKATRLLGVEPARCVVIEDSPNGTASGIAAGCQVVAIPHADVIPPHPRLTTMDSMAAVDLDTLRALF